MRIAGITDPARRTMLATNLMARVVELRVVEGQRVAEGDLLLRLDIRDLAARRSQAEAAGAANRAQVGLATSSLERSRALEASGAGATVQRESAETAVTVYEASVRGANAALREIDVHLGNSTIRAPFAGIIVRKQTEVGSFAAPGQPLLILEDDSSLRVVSPVPATDAVRLRTGDSYLISFATGEEATGVLDSLVSSGSPGSPGLLATFILPNEDHRLRAGVVASVAIPAPPSSGAAFEVSSAAIVTAGSLRGVYVVRGGRTEIVWCSIDPREQSGRITVLDGLRDGDVIVSDASLAGLRDGQLVVVSR